jgi:hypothetical protein
MSKCVRGGRGEAAPPRHDHQPIASAGTNNGLPPTSTAIDHTSQKDDREQHTPPSPVSTMDYHTYNSTPSLPPPHANRQHTRMTNIILSQAPYLHRGRSRRRHASPCPPPWTPPFAHAALHTAPKVVLHASPRCPPAIWVARATAHKWGLHPPLKKTPSSLIAHHREADAASARCTTLL